jgi:hypothetical protein
MRNSRFVRVWLITFLLMGISCITCAYQNLDKENGGSENFYVNSSMIYLAPNGIFLNFEGECYPINTLCSDANGIYVPSYEMSRKLVWCPICQRWREPNHICSTYK